MEKPSREDHRRRLHAFIEDTLDAFERLEPHGYDLGVIAIHAEILSEAEISDYLKRSDAGYTPDDDVTSYFTYWCSDHRPYVQAALFYDAYYYARELVEAKPRGAAEAAYDSPEDDEEESSDT